MEVARMPLHDADPEPQTNFTDSEEQALLLQGRSDSRSWLDTVHRGLRDLGYSHWRRAFPATCLLLCTLAVAYIVVFKQAPHTGEAVDSSIGQTTELMTNIWKVAHRDWNCPVKYSVMQIKDNLLGSPQGMSFLIHELMDNGARRFAFLEVHNTTEFFPWRGHNCERGHGLGCIFEEAGKTVNLSFTIREAVEVGDPPRVVMGNPVHVKEVIVTFFDIDGHGGGISSPGMEFVSAYGPHQHHWLGGGHSGVIHSDHVYWGNRTGFKVHNPKSPSEVSDKDQASAVSLMYRDVSRFEIALGSTPGPKEWPHLKYPRSFFFSVLFVWDQDASITPDVTAVTARESWEDKIHEIQKEIKIMAEKVQRQQRLIHDLEEDRAHLLDSKSNPGLEMEPGYRQEAKREHEMEQRIAKTFGHTAGTTTTTTTTVVSPPSPPPIFSLPWAPAAGAPSETPSPVPQPTTSTTSTTRITSTTSAKSTKIATTTSTTKRTSTSTTTTSTSTTTTSTSTSTTTTTTTSTTTTTTTPTTTTTSKTTSTTTRIIPIPWWEATTKRSTSHAASPSPYDWTVAEKEATAKTSSQPTTKAATTSSATSTSSTSTTSTTTTTKEGLKVKKIDEFAYPLPEITPDAGAGWLSTLVLTFVVALVVVLGTAIVFRLQPAPPASYPPGRVRSVKIWGVDQITDVAFTYSNGTERMFGNETSNGKDRGMWDFWAVPAGEYITKVIMQREGTQHGFAFETSSAARPSHWFGGKTGFLSVCSASGAIAELTQEYSEDTVSHLTELQFESAIPRTRVVYSSDELQHARRQSRLRCGSSVFLLTCLLFLQWLSGANLFGQWQLVFDDACRADDVNILSMTKIETPLWDWLSLVTRHSMIVAGSGGKNFISELAPADSLAGLGRNSVQCRRLSDQEVKHVLAKAGHADRLSKCSSSATMHDFFVESKRYLTAHSLYDLTLTSSRGYVQRMEKELGEECKLQPEASFAPRVLAFLGSPFQMIWNESEHLQHPWNVVYKVFIIAIVCIIVLIAQHPLFIAADFLIHVLLVGVWIRVVDSMAYGLAFFGFALSVLMTYAVWLFIKWLQETHPFSLRISHLLWDAFEAVYDDFTEGHRKMTGLKFGCAAIVSSWTFRVKKAEWVLAKTYRDMFMKEGDGRILSIGVAS